MVVGSVCSGIEAASVAWHPLGWTTAWVSEIDPFCSALLSYRFPGIHNYGDFTGIGADVPGIDLLVGGTPCQSFSIAGLRGGMDDHRGNLALEFCRLADRLRPRWIVWENVPGVLSSNGGRDFGSILGALGELGYGTAYRVLDAKHFGIPQRRRRVFVVGYLGDWRRAAGVLFERYSLSGYPPPRREARQDAAPAIGASTDDGSGLGKPHAVATFNNTGHGWWNETETATGLRDMNAGSGSKEATLIASTGHISHCLNAGGMGRIDYETETLITAFSCKDHGTDAGELSPTLRAMEFDGSHANGGGQIAVAFQSSQSGVREAEAHATLDGNNGSRRRTGVRQGSAARRLTPLECERLQGFPDMFTAVPYRGALAKDGPRYKALGNSMAVPVMHWLGERLQAVESCIEMSSK